MVRIAVDAMGGDHAPAQIVDGAVAAARHLDIGVALVGQTAAIEEALASHSDWRTLGIDIVEAPDVVGMADSPVASLRRKPRSSIRVAAELVASQEAAALFSAGSTGAAVMAAYSAFGMIPGVDRPALATIIPTRQHRTVLLDAGANADARPEHLLQFAHMGAIFAHEILDIARPEVRLLSIGEEAEKGNQLTLDAHALLAASELEFAGNAESRDLLAGAADVVVSDGFTGNVALKLLEGTIKTVLDALRAEIVATRRGKLGGLLIRPAARRLRSQLDPETYGGAYLLGLRGLSVIAHGNSSRRAISNAIHLAARGVEHDVVGRLAARMPERRTPAAV